MYVGDLKEEYKVSCEGSSIIVEDGHPNAMEKLGKKCCQVLVEATPRILRTERWISQKKSIIAHDHQ
uniref:Uncharacterized protein n=1 Tax=Peronospora matthiolae TaxID=2874970 RepID=A0AAV1VGD0_9STRA